MIPLCILHENGSAETVVVQPEPCRNLVGQLREIIRQARAADRASRSQPVDEKPEPAAQTGGGACRQLEAEL
jgi:hypothetical protein